MVVSKMNNICLHSHGNFQRFNGRLNAWWQRQPEQLLMYSHVTRTYTKAVVYVNDAKLDIATCPRIRTCTRNPRSVHSSSRLKLCHLAIVMPHRAATPTPAVVDLGCSTGT